LFDRGLRLLIFDAIETIEITFRTQLIYQPSMSSGGFWFEDAANFDDASLHTEHLRKLDEEVERVKILSKYALFVAGEKRYCQTFRSFLARRLSKLD